MTNNPLPVKGYTGQSDEKVAIVNDNKQTEEVILRRIEELVGLKVADPRWAAVAKTHFEEGFMCLNRAVFQPERLKDID